jgi:hypothetical protein
MPRRAVSNITAVDGGAVPPDRNQHPPNKQLHRRLSLNRNPTLKLPRLQPTRPSKRKNHRVAAGPANLPSNRKHIQLSRRSVSLLLKPQPVRADLNAKKNHPLVPILAAAGIPVGLDAISAALRRPPGHSA